MFSLNQGCHCFLTSKLQMSREIALTPNAIMTSAMTSVVTGVVTIAILPTIAAVAPTTSVTSAAPNNHSIPTPILGFFARIAQTIFIRIDNVGKQLIKKLK